MPVYMSQFSYTPEAWAAMGNDPVDRREGINALMQGIGGRLIELYYAFGDYDGVLLFEAPDDASAAAALITSIGAGHLKSNHTTKLLTVEEALQALRRAKDLKFRGPSTTG